jgi:hypothetical protein
LLQKSKLLLLRPEIAKILTSSRKKAGEGKRNHKGDKARQKRRQLGERITKRR